MKLNRKALRKADIVGCLSHHWGKNLDRLQQPCATNPSPNPVNQLCWLKPHVEIFGLQNVRLDQIHCIATFEMDDSNLVQLSSSQLIWPVLAVLSADGATRVSPTASAATFWGRVKMATDSAIQEMLLWAWPPQCPQPNSLDIIVGKW